MGYITEYCRGHIDSNLSGVQFKFEPTQVILGMNSDNFWVSQNATDEYMNIIKGNKQVIIKQGDSGIVLYDTDIVVSLHGNTLSFTNKNIANQPISLPKDGNCCRFVTFYDYVAIKIEED